MDSRFVLDLDTVTPLVLRDIEEFLRNEHTFCEQYPDIYEAVPESRTPQPRGQNTINGILTKLRTFFIWANDMGKTTNNPFRNYAVEECVYGTPCMIYYDKQFLPKALELEAAVLGAPINEAETMTQIVSVLEPEYFSNPTNVAIYRMMRENSRSLE